MPRRTGRRPQGRRRGRTRAPPCRAAASPGRRRGAARGGARRCSWWNGDHPRGARMPTLLRSAALPWRGTLSRVMLVAPHTAPLVREPESREHEQRDGQPDGLSGVEGTERGEEDPEQHDRPARDPEGVSHMTGHMTNLRLYSRTIKTVPTASKSTPRTRSHVITSSSTPRMPNWSITSESVSWPEIVSVVTRPPP